jgi:hypothetical protein
MLTIQGVEADFGDALQDKKKAGLMARPAGKFERS